MFLVLELNDHLKKIELVMFQIDLHVSVPVFDFLHIYNTSSF